METWECACNDFRRQGAIDCSLNDDGSIRAKFVDVILAEGFKNRRETSLQQLNKPSDCIINNAEPNVVIVNL